MPIAPTNPPLDHLALTENAFKALINGLTTGFNFYVSYDTAKHVHPAVLIRAMASRFAITPSAGIFSVRAEIDLQEKLDFTGNPTAGQNRQKIRQTFYRNDNSMDPMRDLAIRLTNAVPQDPFTCLGIMPADEGPTIADSEVRVYAYKFAFTAHVTPLR